MERILLNEKRSRDIIFSNLSRELFSCLGSYDRTWRPRLNGTMPVYLDVDSEENGRMELSVTFFTNTPLLQFQRC